MRNIHVIPTDKPSRLYKSKITQDVFISDNMFQHGDATYNVNIYITSDEEIKEGDWCHDIFLQAIFQANSFMGIKTKNTAKKIILTTDQELIKDGVQAIDDEFLEWFVKNPSCEEVEVGYGWIRLTETDNEGYWVSIPNKQFEIQQEEPKQETLEEVAQRLYPINIVVDYDTNEDIRNIWIEGANWMRDKIKGGDNE